MAKKRRTRGSGKTIHHIIVRSKAGDVDVVDSGAQIFKGDQIWWHPVDTDFKVEIQFKKDTPVNEKHPQTILAGRTLKKTVTGAPGSYAYGTPGILRKSHGEPQIIVDPGPHDPFRKRGRKAGKKR